MQDGNAREPHEFPSRDLPQDPPQDPTRDPTSEQQWSSVWVDAPGRPMDVGVTLVSPLEVEFWQILAWGKVVVHYAALHFMFSIFWAFVPGYWWKAMSALFSPAAIYGTIYFKKRYITIYIGYLSLEILGFIIILGLGMDSVWWVLLVIGVQLGAILYTVSFSRYIPSEGFERYTELYAALAARAGQTRIVLV
eukprot:TRINITY_DN7645_c0_g1_i2.p1 TRINITY_DN7645_c0_g1~~TRINITY_DN7645_c0_g1_i2.p1  ORF type:complete len:193 (-),score=31.34 TRINITY_DN7645_c0_g1_i2:321-899(-)